MTKEIARAAAMDAGNAHMRKAGRTKWDHTDFYAASRAYNKLWPAYYDMYEDTSTN
jgi:hypothetical protein